MIYRSTSTRFEIRRAMADHIKVCHPVHRIGPAGDAPAMGVQRSLFQAASAPPLFDHGSPLPTSVGMAEHVFEREQWADQERKESSFSRRFVLCPSQAAKRQTLDLISGLVWG